ncbi:hypothetical protein D1007_22426 [Hordeum vulgare]|nr:hypothetical protein D1007_22426 [Hordeum vulgare]
MCAAARRWHRRAKARWRVGVQTRASGVNPACRVTDALEQEVSGRAVAVAERRGCGVASAVDSGSGAASHASGHRQWKQVLQGVAAGDGSVARKWPDEVRCMQWLELHGGQSAEAAKPSCSISDTAPKSTFRYRWADQSWCGPVVSAAAVRVPATGQGTPARRKVAMAYIPGEALRRPASSSCKVVGTPAMEAEAHRLHSSALVLTAIGHFSGISADSVARAVERELRFPASDFVVAPFFPEDFLLTMFQPAQRDMALERRSISVAGVMFKLRPWLPPAGTSRIWHYYCRVAIEKLPLTAWDWDSVKEVLGKDCELDLIERQSTIKANCAALFAWLWTWHPDKIPRAADFSVL